MSDLPPYLERKHFGRYEVICPIDQGGMASVYVGRLSSMAGFERLVAIKVIHEHLSTDPAFIEMFLNEARIAAGISHPNVGEVFEVGKDGGLFYMVGELVKGQSLRAFYRRAKKCDMAVHPAMSAYIASRVCYGAHVAHELCDQDGKPINLIHRDISPKNVLISYDGFVKLIDFGVAWIRGKESKKDSEAMKGKLGYMSPEQMRNESIDKRSDIFSLGIVMYMMFTGHHPFSANTDEERIEKLLSGYVAPPRDHNPDLDVRIEEIVLTALAANKEERFENAAVMGDALADYARGEIPQIGSRMLSEFMHQAFDDDKNAFEAQLREYRKKHEAEKETFSAFDFDKQKNQSTPTTTSYAVSERQTAPSKFRWIVATSAMIALIGMGLGIVFKNQSDVSAPPHLTAKTPSKMPPPVVDASTRSVLDTDQPAAHPQQQATVKIELDLKPTEAAVFLDDTALAKGTSVVELVQDGQSHTLRFQAEGYEQGVTTVVADEDKQLVVHLEPLEEADDKKSGQGERRSRRSKRELKLKENPYQ
ncbi:MAG: serine/threonine-protein kinase [Myxococcota bacterium]|nr:serine/threonine-protein kinase [Myxococcota bacterium]